MDGDTPKCVDDHSKGKQMHLLSMKLVTFELWHGDVPGQNFSTKLSALHNRAILFYPNFSSCDYMHIYVYEDA